MIGSRRAGRILAPLLLGLLATWNVDGRAMADDPAASLSTSFRRAAARARGSLVSVRIPDGFLPPSPALSPAAGATRPPLMAPFVDRQTEGEVARASRAWSSMPTRERSSPSIRRPRVRPSSS